MISIISQTDHVWTISPLGNDFPIGRSMIEYEFGLRLVQVMLCGKTWSINKRYLFQIKLVIFLMATLIYRYKPTLTKKGGETDFPHWMLDHGRTGKRNWDIV